jgi:hypothetical protein
MEKLWLFGALICILAACGESPTLAPTAIPIPPSTTTPTLVPLQAATPTLKPESCWDEWKRTQSESALVCASETYRLAIEQYPNIAENHFRLGVLNWEGGQAELGREEILNAIELDVKNGEYVEYLYGKVIPPPVQINIQGELPIYTEQFDVPYFTVQGGDVSLFEVTEVHAPKNVAQGASAIRLEWKKNGNPWVWDDNQFGWVAEWRENGSSWASLVIGFDKDIANQQKALEGGLASLGGLDPSNLDEYALTFWAKSEGIQGSEYPENGADVFLRIKLQDQNLAVRESIGNQKVSQVELKRKWEEYTIPLDKFVTDEWVARTLCPTVPWECESLDLLYFDWSRVKQINFDVPFYSTNGVIYLDDIRIIRED